MSRPTVYVVDDDDAVRDSIALLLETAGLGVETFADAEAFRSAWRSDMAGCLLPDLRMPGSSGTDLQAFLVEQHSRLPIIFSPHTGIFRPRCVQSRPVHTTS